MRRARQEPGALTHLVDATAGGSVGASAALLLATLAPLAYRHVRERPATPDPVRFQIPPIVEFGGRGHFSVSPDGRRLAFVGRGSDGIARIWIRALDSLEIRPLPGSETGDLMPPPFWSPDGRFVAFDSGGKLKKLDVTGGPAQALSDTPYRSPWADRGTFKATSSSETSPAVCCVSARPAARRLPSRPSIDRRQEEFHLLPTFLPDGRHFVYLRVAPGAPDNGGVYVGTLDATPEAQSMQRLMPYAVGLTYVASGDSGPGRLLFLREGTLMAQPFDATRLSLAGDAVPVAERVGSFRDGGYFSASDNGVLVYRTADADSQVTWFDRQGTVTGRASEPGGFSRRGSFSGWRSGGCVAHESAGRGEGRPVAARPVAWQRSDTIDAWRRHGRVSCLVDGRQAHHLHARQQPAPSETGKRRGRRGGSVASEQRRARQGVRLVAGRTIPPVRHGGRC